MIYLRNRYYDPSVGRFISEDPVKDGSNWYVYCGNNPVMFVDPSGLAVDLKSAVEKCNGKYEEDENGVVTVIMNGITKTYDNEKIGGHIFVSGDQLAEDFNMPGWLFTPSSYDKYESEEDAVIAWGAMYNPISCREGVEYQTYIYQDGEYYYIGKTFKGDETDIDSETGRASRTVYADLPEDNAVAWVHTHGPYFKNADGTDDVYTDIFTGGWINSDGSTQGDGAYSRYLELNGYLFTPGGQFKYLNGIDWEWDENTAIYHIYDTNPIVSVLISSGFPN